MHKHSYVLAFYLFYIYYADTIQIMHTHGKQQYIHMQNISSNGSIYIGNDHVLTM